MKSITVFIILILFLFLFGHANGENQFEYHKNGSPLFTFGKEPLIKTLNASYVVNNYLYTGTYSQFDAPYKFQDVDFAYSISGVKYNGMYVKSVNPVFLPFLFNDSTPNGIIFAGYPIVEATFGGTGPNILVISTTKTDVDEYFNGSTTQGEILVNYYTDNPKVTEINPIILNLGKWPNRVNVFHSNGLNEGYDIEDILNTEINNDTILIFGSNTSLIVNKGDWGYSNFQYDDYMKYNIIQHSVFSERNPSFNYIFYKLDDNYFLRLQRVTPIENGTLFLYFRPVRTDYSISIDNPKVRDIMTESQIKPILELNTHDNKINKFDFGYQDHGMKKITPCLPDENGNFLFDKDIDADPESTFFYPFEGYTSKINVTPPLLIADRDIIQLSKQDSKEYEAYIDINYNKITIKIIKKLEPIIVYIASILTIIVGYIIYLKSESSKPFLGWAIISIIIGIVGFYATNGFDHLICIGTVFLSIALIITWDLSKNKSTM
jgi:hypothetical protein